MLSKRQQNIVSAAHRIETLVRSIGRDERAVFTDAFDAELKDERSHRRNFGRGRDCSLPAHDIANIFVMKFIVEAALSESDSVSSKDVLSSKTSWLIGTAFGHVHKKEILSKLESTDYAASMSDADLLSSFVYADDK